MRRRKALYVRIIRTELTCEFFPFLSIRCLRFGQWSFLISNKLYLQECSTETDSRSPENHPFLGEKNWDLLSMAMIATWKEAKEYFSIMFMAEKLVLGCWTEEQLCLPEREHWVLPLYLLGRTNKKKPHDKGTIFFCWSTHFSFSFWSTVVLKLEKRKKPINKV